MSKNIKFEFFRTTLLLIQNWILLPTMLRENTQKHLKSFLWQNGSNILNLQEKEIQFDMSHVPLGCFITKLKTSFTD